MADTFDLTGFGRGVGGSEGEGEQNHSPASVAIGGCIPSTVMAPVARPDVPSSPLPASDHCRVRVALNGFGITRLPRFGLPI
jgi:hypothetical protein